MRGAVVAAALVLAACAGGDADDAAVQDTAQQGMADSAAPAAPGGGDSISVSFIDRSGQNAGTAQLMQHGGGVQIAVRVTGLTPGEHGFHVHENGQCTAPAFESAGGHYSPESKQHGLQNPQGPHAGDLPNLRANESGVADTTFHVDGLAFTGGSAPLIREGGLALVVHAGPDDYRTDPSGNSGDRVACAVLRR